MLPRELHTRQRFALRLVRDRLMDPEDALRLTVWPSAALEEVPAQTFWPAELAEEARRLFAAGLSAPAVAERLAVPFLTVKAWIWNEVPDGYRRNGERPTTVAS